ncbi:MAG: cofactor-independent phosphoglycerate mutase [Deltaproteobacteria bacterium]|nr:cofactor-independent phosphoglycerate mutase [Deltaproteobacteria bacterium]
MKYVILLGDGMADYSIESLGNKTPLEASATPNMNRIASEGTIGLIDTIPPGMTPGSDVANLSVMGYDPILRHTGRGPLEAASMGLPLGFEDVAFRCNLVTISGDEEPTMEDFTAGHISSEEAAEIVKSLNGSLRTDHFVFYPGVGYRHLLVWKGGPADLDTTPPHDITGKSIQPHLPKGDMAPALIELMEAAAKLLKNHPVNEARLKNARRAVTSIWPWGQGKAPRMEPLTKRFGLRGGVISAVDLLRGIGVYAGLEILPVEGATGYIDTNYSGKARTALEFLKNGDFLFLHVEAPDEMGHEGNLDGKIHAIEDFDSKIVGALLEGLPSLGDFRIVVASDHPTPIALKTHVADPSPFAVLSSRKDENAARGFAFSERDAKASGIFITPGCRFIDHFIGDWRTIVGQSRA